jgi:hypothetical protein
MSKWLAFYVVIFTSACVLAADEIPTDWIDPDTGHRIIRLSVENGSRTLYFHDNSYTPEGDKLIFNTPGGVAVVDITHLGDEPPKMEIVTQGNGAIMARRSREVYVSRGGRGGSTTQPEAQPAIAAATQPAGGRRGFGGGFGGRGGGPVYAVNVDTKESRLISNAPSTIINCDETFGFIVDRGAVDPTGNTPRPATRPVVPQIQRMFPGKTMAELRPEQQYAVQKEDNLARRAISRPASARRAVINTAIWITSSGRRPIRTSCSTPMKEAGTKWIARGPSAATQATCGSCTSAPWTWKSTGTNGGALTGTRYGMICKRRAAWIFGSRA